MAPSADVTLPSSWIGVAASTIRPGPAGAAAAGAASCPLAAPSGFIEVDEATRTLLVVRIAHRAEAYRRPPPTT